MNPILMLLAGVVIGVLIGVLVGWFLRGLRSTAPDNRVESELRGQLDALRSDLGKSSEERIQAERARAAAEASREASEQQRQVTAAQAGTLESELKEAKDKVADLKVSLATAKEGIVGANERIADQKKAHDEQYRLLTDSHEKALADLRQAFSALSAEALKQAQPEFLRLANETLAKFNEGAKGDLAQRQESIATLIKPLEEQLKIYQERLAQSGRSRSRERGPNAPGGVLCLPSGASNG